MLKITTDRKKLKTSTHFSWTTILGMDRWNIKILCSVCHANQSNEYYITLIQSGSEFMSQHPVKKVVWASPATPLV